MRFYIIAYTTSNKLLAVFISNICGFVKEYSLVWLEWQGVSENELNMVAPICCICWNYNMTVLLSPLQSLCQIFYKCVYFLWFYYRAMHVVLARYCYRMSSVRPSVCLSVTLTYAEHIGWTSSKLVTRIISLWSSLLRATTPPI